MCCSRVSSLLWILYLVFRAGNVTGLATGYYRHNSNASLQEYHEHIVNTFFRNRENWTTTFLGSVLFKNQKYPKIEPKIRSKTWNILIWDNLNEQRTFVYGKKSKGYLSDCSVKNCIFHGDKESLKISDAIVINVRHFGSESRVPFTHRSQRHIFYTAESPVHTFPLSRPRLLRISYKLNWSMTYRSDADVPIPYGRVVPLKEPKQISNLESLSKLVPYWNYKTKTVLVAAMISNCNTKYRLELIQSLRKYIIVDFYGRCGDIKYRGIFNNLNCIRPYHFYLALENSLCRQYITEKVFINAFSKGAIPIVKGPPAEDYAKLLPPNSYILVDNFKSVDHLAREIRSISEDNERLLSYHIWRAHFKIMTENGFFGKHPIAFCRLCEAMNYNNLQPSVYTYDDIQLHLEPRILCDLKATILKPTAAPPPRYCYRFETGNCVEL